MKFLWKKNRNDQLLKILKNVKSKENNTFYLKILNGKLKAAEIVLMDSANMADDKVQESRKKVQENDILALIKHSDEINAEKLKPRLKKSNRGDEYVDVQNDFLFGDDIVKKKSLLNVVTDTTAENEKQLVLVASPPVTTKKTPEPIFPNHMLEKSKSIDVITPLSPKISIFKSAKSIIYQNKDTTKDHGTHVLDVNCKICRGLSNFNTSTYPVSPILSNNKVVDSKNDDRIDIDKKYDSDFEDETELVMPIKSKNSIVLKSTQISSGLDFEDLNSDMEIDVLPKKTKNPDLSIPPPPLSLLPRTSTFKTTPEPAILPLSIEKITEDLDYTIFSFDTSITEPQSPTKLVSPTLSTSSSTSSSISSNSIDTLKGNPIWKGNLQMLSKNDMLNHIASMNAMIVPVKNGYGHLHKSLFEKKNQLPKDLKFINKHTMIKNNFWSYLNEFNKKNSLVFIKFESSGGVVDSKMIIKDNPVHVNLTDDNVYNMLCHDFLIGPSVFEFMVPKNLKDIFGRLFLLSLGEKASSEPCSFLLGRYSILLPRNKKQIIGVFIGKKSLEEFENLPPIKIFAPYYQKESNINMVKLISEDPLQPKPIVNKRKSAESVGKVMDSKEYLKRQKLNEDEIFSKTTSPDINNDEIVTKKLPSEIEAPVLKAKIVKQDPRLLKNRDPRLQGHSGDSRIVEIVEKPVELSVDEKIENLFNNILPPLVKSNKTEEFTDRVRDFLENNVLTEENKAKLSIGLVQFTKPSSNGNEKPENIDIPVGNISTEVKDKKIAENEVFVPISPTVDPEKECDTVEPKNLEKNVEKVVKTVITSKKSADKVRETSPDLNSCHGESKENFKALFKIHRNKDLLARLNFDNRNWDLDKNSFKRKSNYDDYKNDKDKPYKTSENNDKKSSHVFRNYNESKQNNKYKNSIYQQKEKGRNVFSKR